MSLYNQNLHIPPQFTPIQHRAPQIFKIHHKPSTNEFTSILMKLKYKNNHVVGSTSLHCVIVIVAGGGSSRILVQEAVGEVISCPAPVM
jgi:hypothetical protein